jgi:hypothetical protein
MFTVYLYQYSKRPRSSASLIVPPHYRGWVSTSRSLLRATSLHSRIHTSTTNKYLSRCYPNYFRASTRKNYQLFVWSRVSLCHCFTCYVGRPANIKVAFEIRQSRRSQGHPSYSMNWSSNLSADWQWSHPRRQKTCRR